MEFTPFGAADKIKLTVQIVQNIIAVPTKSGKTCTTRDAMKFMMLCQAQRLNPFAGDAFLIGYDSQRLGPVFSLITAHQAFLKRAETASDYEGMESGVIILVNEDTGEIKEREGDFYLPSEKVVGGWAKVYRKGKKTIYRRLAMEQRKPNYETSFWEPPKATEQIVKCAEADALRASFPTLLGGLTSGENIIDITSERVATDLPARGLVEMRAESTEEKTPEIVGEAQATKPAKTNEGPSLELANIVFGAGFEFSHFQQWGVESGNVANAASLGGFDELPADIAKRLLRAKAGLLDGLTRIKSGGAL